MSAQSAIEAIKDVTKSVFVCANAGSGKTFALIERVLSLLLSGVSPEKILCITYTNAAAVEIKDRIFEKLRIWSAGDFTRSEDCDILKSENLQTKAKQLLQDILISDVQFNIMTFHAFCQKVLLSFSMEAGLYAGFTLIDDREHGEIARYIANGLAGMGHIRENISVLSGVFSYDKFREEIILKAIFGERNEKFKNVLLNPNCVGEIYKFFDVSYFDDLDAAVYAIKAEFVDHDLNVENFERILHDIECLVINKTITKTIESLRERLLKIIDILNTKNAHYARDVFDIICAICLTSAGDIRSIKNLKKIGQYFENWFDGISARAHSAVRNIKNHEAAKISESIVVVTSEVLKWYERYKLDAGKIDYNDLINRARDLLYDNENRDFVLFKLNNGFDHILVDEAQDTNTKEWSILQALLEEFFAGQGSREGKVRTLLVMGDDKQSIYGFQGAEPEVFFKLYLDNRDKFHKVNLTTSYRSTRAVMEAVDVVFLNSDQTKSVTQDPEFGGHSYVRRDYGGIVDVIGILQTDKDVSENDGEWSFPWDDCGAVKSKDREMIAALIDKILDVKTRLGIDYSDIMLLVKKRDSELFEELESALVAQNIKISFNDRIRYQDSLPILDFIASAKFALCKSDEHSLACILKSPMFGLTDGGIYKAFIQRKDSDGLKFFDVFDSQIKESLVVMENAARKLPLNDFFLFLYNTYSAKYRENQVSELLYLFDLVEKYQSTGGATLEGFLLNFDSIKGEQFKIEKSVGNDTVRMMTIHAAKGLEARVVFILNANDFISNKDNSFVFFDDLFAWADAEHRTEKLDVILEFGTQKSYREYVRQLYVAMTRARDEFYIVGVDKENEKNRTWFEILRDFKRIDYSGGYLPKDSKQSDICASEQVVVESDVICVNFEGEAQQSYKIASQYAQNQNKNLGFAIGDSMHAMLEIGADLTYEKAMQFLSFSKDLADKDDVKNMIVTKAMRIIEKYRDIFEMDSMSEVVISNIIEDNTTIGRIDKLIIRGNDIDVIDYKFYENEILDDKIISQMRVYYEILRKIYPLHVINAKILWVKSEKIENIKL